MKCGDGEDLAIASGAIGLNIVTENAGLADLRTTASQDVRTEIQSRNI